MVVEDNGVEPMTSLHAIETLNREQFNEMLANVVFIGVYTTLASFL